MSGKVVIAGAGVSGLTAAQELSERGFDVTVIDCAGEPGGKSRSMSKPGTGIGGRQPLPGEHGFRFFPGFYRHVPDTMSRIPLVRPDGSRGVVLDNLVNTSRSLALSHEGQWVLPNELSSSLRDVGALLEFFYDNLISRSVGVPRDDILHYVRCVFTVLTSSPERRLGELENISAWDFLQAGDRSEAYQKYLVSAVTRSLVACRADAMSARSNIVIGIQILLDIYRNCSDRVLNGPTNAAWIDPWVRYLEQRGVRFRYDSQLARIRLDGNRVRSLILTDGRELEADYFILGLPGEVLQGLVDGPLLAKAPSLGRLSELRRDWMNGIVFYLDRDIELNHGHTIFMDSPWALTSLFQQRFWSDPVEGYGDGRVGSILSVCISDFNAVGDGIKKTAKQCSPDELQQEVWSQIKRHLRGDALRDLESAKILDCFIDPSLTWRAEGLHNSAPLFINTAGSWAARPDSDVGLANCFLAGDFVRTNTDVATMESANESARRAANLVLDRTESTHERCQIFPLDEPELLAPLKTLDRLRYDAGLPHLLEIMPDFSRAAVATLATFASKSAQYSEQGASAMRQLGWDRRLPEVESTVLRVAHNLQTLRRRLTVDKGSSVGVRDASREPGESRYRRLIEITVGVSDSALEADLASLGNRLLLALEQMDEHFAAQATSPAAHHVEGALGEFLTQPSKRIRATCALLSAGTFRRHLSDASVQAAIVAESIHAATLLHDDIIDQAAERRGQPTVWKRFGTGTGLLAGNLLVSRAVRSLYQLGYAGLADHLFEVIEQMIAAEAAQMSARRGLDLSEDAYREIIGGKTAALFSWSCRAGATVGGCPSVAVEALASYGWHLGLAFQMVDDVIDVDPRLQNTSKSRYTDLSTGTLSYPLIIGRQRAEARFRELADRNFEDWDAVAEWLLVTGALNEAREGARAHVREAIAALSPIRHCPAKLALGQLARSSVERDS